MIKRTLCFSSPAYLSLKMSQLAIRIPGKKESDSQENDDLVRTVPIEDIGIVVLDNQQITITQGAMSALLDNNCAVITCGPTHLPVGLMLPLCGNTIQNERFRSQIDASLPLKKQLWQQTVKSKILNQASALEYATGRIHNNMLEWSGDVRSGDPANLEARAAVYYWKTLFEDCPDFIRGQFEDYPNIFLNYGYAVLRAVIARALVCSGLLPTLGIHHHNRYNAYCLADDIMEPYRPFVDRLVLEIIDSSQEHDLTREIKTRLLAIPTIEVMIDGKRSPLMVAATTTTASVAKYFAGISKRILYPEMSNG